MTSSSNSLAWDLSPVLDLIQSLSRSDIMYRPRPQSPSDVLKTTAAGASLGTEQNNETALGDFNSLWDFLGVQRDIPPPKIPTFEASIAGNTTQADVYVSDGALYYPPSSKTVKWRDEEDGVDLTDVQLESLPEDTPLTKNQRKKRNRKARKAAEAAAAGNLPMPAAAAAVTPSSVAKAKGRGRHGTISSQSDADTAPSHTRDSLLTKPSAENMIFKSDFPPTASHILESRAPNGQIPNVADPRLVLDSYKPLHGKSNGSPRPNQIDLKMPKLMPEDSLQQPLKFGSSFVEKQNTRRAPENPVLGSIKENLDKQWSADSQFSSKGSLLTPQKPRPRSGADTQFVAQGTSAPTTFITSTPNSGRKRFEILPLAFDNPIDRNWSLLLKLIQAFPEDRPHLLSPLQLSINRSISNGIHVFVDASNIFIGFHDTMKRARGIPHYAHVPRVDLNFHALALLLERRRPITKRVLAGSTPEIHAFEEAREVGYETCILDKVWKAKELTERQRRFAVRGFVEPNGYNSGSDSTGKFLNSGNSFAASPVTINSTNDALPLQQPKWVEQAVDEILHLKILESIVDTPTAPQFRNLGADRKTPESKNVEDSAASGASPIMVLATGDAAEAEYSSGFMKMVQRALQKGWKVEIVAWSRSVSAEYRKMADSAALQARFRIIELDEYAEELFGEAI